MSSLGFLICYSNLISRSQGTLVLSLQKLQLCPSPCATHIAVLFRGWKGKVSSHHSNHSSMSAENAAKAWSSKFLRQILSLFTQCWLALSPSLSLPPLLQETAVQLEPCHPPTIALESRHPHGSCLPVHSWEVRQTFLLPQTPGQSHSEARKSKGGLSFSGQIMGWCTRKAVLSLPSRTRMQTGGSQMSPRLLLKVFPAKNQAPNVRLVWQVSMKWAERESQWKHKSNGNIIMKWFILLAQWEEGGR